MNSLTIILFAAVLAVASQTGCALQCFQCISGTGYEGDACADPFDHELAKSRNLLKDCGSLPEDIGATEKRNYTMCRKFVQDVEGEYRVVRGCATKGRPGKCIDRTGTAKIKLQYCECENDNPDQPCNFAPQTVVSNAVLAVTFFSTAFTAVLLQ